MLGNYGTPRMQVSHGRGAWLWDLDGNRYLDLLAGIAVSALGHGDPRLVAAIAEQSSMFLHTSNLYAHEPGIALAEKLLSVLDFEGKVLFTQDGATANEAALKLARMAALKKSPQRTRFISTHGGFHGRTHGALALTGNPAKRDPFAPFGYEVEFVPFGDIEWMSNILDGTVAAVMLEPIQGENGVVVPPDDYLQEVAALCRSTGALLIVDEVQSGMGRTGEWSCALADGVKPDVITFAKGLAGGLPIGAMVVATEHCDVFHPGDHGTTFGGNPVSAACALAVIDAIESDELLTNSDRLGLWLKANLEALNLPEIKEIRGRGLWLGVEFKDDRASAVELAAFNQGFLVNAAKPNVLRLSPPLNIEVGQLQLFVDAFTELVQS